MFFRPPKNSAHLGTIIQALATGEQVVKFQHFCIFEQVLLLLLHHRTSGHEQLNRAHKSGLINSGHYSDANLTREKQGEAKCNKTNRIGVEERPISKVRTARPHAITLL